MDNFDILHGKILQYLSKYASICENLVDKNIQHRKKIRKKLQFLAKFRDQKQPKTAVTSSKSTPIVNNNKTTFGLKISKKCIQNQTLVLTIETIKKKDNQVKIQKRQHQLVLVMYTSMSREPLVFTTLTLTHIGESWVITENVLKICKKCYSVGATCKTQMMTVRTLGCLFYNSRHRVMSLDCVWVNGMTGLTDGGSHFRMRITLGVVLIRSLVSHVCVPECSRNGFGMRMYLLVREKFV